MHMLGIEWVSDYCLTLNVLFSAISWLDHITFRWHNDDGVWFVLDLYAKMDIYSSNSLRKQYTGRHVAPSRHTILIQSRLVCALISFHAAHLVEKQQAPIWKSLVWSDRIYRTRCDHANNYTTESESWIDNAKHYYYTMYTEWY